MYRSLFALFAGILMVSSAQSQGAVQTYKTCSTGALTPSGWAQTAVGPFQILVQFDPNGYFVDFAGVYGARRPQRIHQSIPAIRTNAIDTNGRQIFNLTGNAETLAGQLDFVLSMQDVGNGSAFIRIQDMSKSTWQGRVLCR